MWISHQYDNCDALAGMYFSKLSTTKSTKSLFRVSFEILKYCGKTPKCVQSSSFAKYTLIMKSAFPKWNLMISVIAYGPPTLLFP